MSKADAYKRITVIIDDQKFEGRVLGDGKVKGFMGRKEIIIHGRAYKLVAVAEVPLEEPVEPKNCMCRICPCADTCGKVGNCESEISIRKGEVPALSMGKYQT